MMNYQRRRRQASEDSDILIQNFADFINNAGCIYQGNYCIKNEADLMDIIERIRGEAQEKASQIQPDWSIPIILEAIAKLYYGKHKKYVGYGTVFKRALVYLWKANESSLTSKKSLGSVEEVLRLSFVLECLYGYKKFFLVSDEFELELNNGYCCWKEEFEPMIQEFAWLLQGRGTRMRVAEENSTLMLEKSKEFFEALKQVLDGVTPQKIEVFRNTFYEKIPGIDDRECKRFWQSVFFRYSLFLSSMIDKCNCAENEEEWSTGVSLFHEFAIEIEEGLFTQDIIRETFWNREWIAKQDDERYGNLIVERPILRITPDGDFAMCSCLIGDSINYFIEGQIFDYSFRSPKIYLPKIVFKTAFSDVFEDTVINGLRELGFCAGHVTEEGIWKVQEEDIILRTDDDTRLFGEIDALAYIPHLNFAILAECKVLNDVRDYRSYKNIEAKLVGDSEGFQYKILEKSKWVNKALAKRYNTEVEAVCVILTDIPLPIVDFPNDAVLLLDVERFFVGISELLEKY